MKNKYIIEKDYVRIILNRPKNTPLETYIDIDDFDRVNNFEGSIYPRFSPNNNDYYATINIINPKDKNKKTTLRLHRFILNFPDDKFVVDHINHNRLDNRKNNLRVVTQKENTKNRGKLNSTNKSGYRNVYRSGKFWRVYLQINGKSHLFPEKFETPEKADKFARKMRKKYYGKHSGI